MATNGTPATMNDTDRLQLHFGTYCTPRFEYGQVVACESRGDVVIVGSSDAPIPWPLGRVRGARGRPSPVLYRGLIKAVKKESALARERIDCRVRSRVTS